MLGQLAGTASDALLAHVAWYMGKQLKASEEIGADLWRDRWQLLAEYWEFRIAALRADPSLEPDSTRKEADSFAAWLGAVDVGPGEIEQELAVTIQLATIGYSLEQAAAYLLKHVCHADPDGGHSRVRSGESMGQRA